MKISKLIELLQYSLHTVGDIEVELTAGEKWWFSGQPKIFKLQSVSTTADKITLHGTNDEENLDDEYEGFF